MLTPQDIQEAGFSRAVFGGYDVASVDDFLEPLTQDYVTLYKENAVLKSKMRLLVDKLEEYRRNEDGMKSALIAAQKTCDEMVAKAEKQCADMLAEAESNARKKSENVDSAINGEQERLNRAKAATRDFIQTVEAELKRQLDALGSLKLLDLETAPAAPAAPAPQPEPQRKAYDFEADKQPPKSEEPDDIANEIEHNVERIMENVSAPQEDLSATKVMPALHAKPRGADKFADLQFGKNYDPTKP
ncbi:MAG: DivIVA domain-containing protein [Faecousia sp.]